MDRDYIIGLFLRDGGRAGLWNDQPLSYQQLNIRIGYRFEHLCEELGYLGLVKLDFAVSVIVDELQSNGALRKHTEKNAGDYYIVDQAAIDLFAEHFLNSRPIGRLMKLAGSHVLDAAIEAERSGVSPQAHVSPNANVSQLIADSSLWTGLSNVKINYRNVDAISKMIDNALDAVDTVSNSGVMQAQAYLRSAKILLHSPEPPADLIWLLIGRAADFVGLISLFYAIFSQAVL